MAPLAGIVNRLKNPGLPQSRQTRPPYAAILAVAREPSQCQRAAPKIPKRCQADATVMLLRITLNCLTDIVSRNGALSNSCG